ncbi:MAG: TlyA family RNA methyltransferase [Hyphomicrobiaceae bacterium]
MPTEPAEPQRLDVALQARGLVGSRSRARDLILRGAVTVAGEIVTKPARLVAAADLVEITAGRADDISRGAEKLRAAIAAFALDARDAVALDIGASTGGFTQVLLEGGAARVYAVDVGHGQLHPTLSADPRVLSLERLDARSLEPRHVPEPVGVIVADVSFISLTLALPRALTFAAPGAWLAALVKPQFEAGPAAVGKGGIVRDAADRLRALDKVRGWLAEQPDWQVLGTETSPITGGSGNIEFLLAGRHRG